MFSLQDMAIEAHMEVVGKVMIDGILEVIEAIMANSMMTQVEIASGHEVHLADHIVINLHYVQAVRIENPSLMTLFKKMLPLQVCRYTYICKNSILYV